MRLLTTVAARMGVALENARLFDETQRLLKETEQRAAELAVINSIQEGMAAELDFQAIVDLVGDKLREVFNTGDIGIRWYDRKRISSTSCTHTSMACGSTASRSNHSRTGAAGPRCCRSRQPLVANTPRRRRGARAPDHPGHRSEAISTRAWFRSSAATACSA